MLALLVIAATTTMILRAACSGSRAGRWRAIPRRVRARLLLSDSYLPNALACFFGRVRAGGRTASGTISTAASTSSCVFIRLSEKRTLPRARDSLRPMARSTCEGSVAPDWQADPPEIASPFKSSAMTRASASTSSNQRLLVLATRGAAGRR